MSEVQYFLTDAVIDENEKEIPVSHAIRVVFASHFDRVTAERDALQKRLTAADERNDNRDSEIFKQVQSALRRSFSLGQIYWQQADSDSTYQQNNSDQTMEVQEQHILNVLKSLDAALKPAEVERQALELEGGHFEGHFPPGACMALPLGSTFTIIPADNGNKMCDCNQGRMACNGKCKPAGVGGAAARLALRPENQRITPARFKCLACGEYHEGTSNLPRPSMSPYSRIEQ